MSTSSLNTPQAFRAEAETELVCDERLYQFNKICRATLSGQAALAQLLMKNQAMFIAERNDVRLYRVFLNAMNQAHYHLFLHEFDISLHELCYKHGLVFHEVETWEDFLRAGREILDGYAKAAIAMREGDNTGIPRVIQYIRSHLDGDLSLEVLADQVYLNKSYFCTLFREVTGKNVTHFIRAERMRQADLLLVGTDYSVEEIAKRCGYNSSAYFATVFKRYYNMQPSEYRLRHREMIAESVEGGANECSYET
ncbi:MAG: AraC family transcriptional regulator [Eubacteriales bacterium]|nr:AraC family transcriptional regulator [Eubacteriales bacterium]